MNDLMIIDKAKQAIKDRKFSNFKSIFKKGYKFEKGKTPFDINSNLGKQNIKQETLKQEVMKAAKKKKYTRNALIGGGGVIGAGLIGKHIYDKSQNKQAIELCKEEIYKQASEAHPGFQAVAGKIAAKQGISKERASAILAASSRHASPAAKKVNPKLKRVK